MFWRNQFQSINEKFSEIQQCCMQRTSCVFQELCYTGICVLCPIEALVSFIKYEEEFPVPTPCATAELTAHVFHDCSFKWKMVIKLTEFYSMTLWLRVLFKLWSGEFWPIANFLSLLYSCRSYSKMKVLKHFAQRCLCSFA